MMSFAKWAPLKLTITTPPLLSTLDPRGRSYPRRPLDENSRQNPEDSYEMQGDERQVEADDQQPEVPAAQLLAQHPPSGLREPVVHRCEDIEEDRTNQHKME